MPIAGPWITLAHRGRDESDQRTERLSRALLVTDGIAQALGALEMLAGLLPAAQHTVLETNAVRVRPWSPRLGIGVTASGHF